MTDSSVEQEEAVEQENHGGSPTCPPEEHRHTEGRASCLTDFTNEAYMQRYENGIAMSGRGIQNAFRSPYGFGLDRCSDNVKMTPDSQDSTPQDIKDMRNERERMRWRKISDKFAELRNCVPRREYEELSQLNTLKRASRYIGFLSTCLSTGRCDEEVARTICRDEEEDTAMDPGPMQSSPTRPKKYRRSKPDRGKPSADETPYSGNSSPVERESSLLVRCQQCRKAFLPHTPAQLAQSGEMCRGGPNEDNDVIYLCHSCQGRNAALAYWDNSSGAVLSRMPPSSTHGTPEMEMATASNGSTKADSTPDSRNEKAKSKLRFRFNTDYRVEGEEAIKRNTHYRPYTLRKLRRVPSPDGRTPATDADEKPQNVPAPTMVYTQQHVPTLAQQPNQHGAVSYTPTGHIQWMNGSYIPASQFNPTAYSHHPPPVPAVDANHGIAPAEGSVTAHARQSPDAPSFNAGRSGEPSVERSNQASGSDSLPSVPQPPARVRSLGSMTELPLLVPGRRSQHKTKHQRTALGKSARKESNVRLTDFALLSEYARQNPHLKDKANQLVKGKSMEDLTTLFENAYCRSFPDLHSQPHTTCSLSQSSLIGPAPVVAKETVRSGRRHGTPQIKDENQERDSGLADPSSDSGESRAESAASRQRQSPVRTHATAVPSASPVFCPQPSQSTASQQPSDSSAPVNYVLMYPGSMPNVQHQAVPMYQPGSAVYGHPLVPAQAHHPQVRCIMMSPQVQATPAHHIVQPTATQHVLQPMSYAVAHPAAHQLIRQPSPSAANSRGKGTPPMLTATSSIASTTAKDGADTVSQSQECPGRDSTPELVRFPDASVSAANRAEPKHPTARRISRSITSRMAMSFSNPAQARSRITADIMAEPQRRRKHRNNLGPVLCRTCERQPRPGCEDCIESPFADQAYSDEDDVDFTVYPPR